MAQGVRKDKKPVCYEFLMSKIQQSFYILWLLVLVLLSSPVRGTAEVQVTDDLGRVITLREPAKRIISLYGAYSEIIFAIGAGDSLVARTRADKFPPAILDKPSVGTHLRPNLELVLGLQPDLIILAHGRKDGHEVIDQIKRKGLTVASFQPSTFEELFSVINRLGTLTDRAEAAGELVERMQGRLDRLSERLTNNERRPTVFFEVRYPNLLGAGQKSIVNDVILKAGGINCLPNKKKLVRINIEALIAYDPEVYVVQRGPMNRNPGDPKDRSNFQAIKAVRQGRVLFVDEYLFSRPGPRSVDAAEILATYFHPEAVR
jgi:iron complex transport system substrate-binding protein